MFLKSACCGLLYCFCLRRSTLTRRGAPLAPLETWRVASPTPQIKTKAFGVYKLYVIQSSEVLLPGHPSRRDGRDHARDAGGTSRTLIGGPRQLAEQQHSLNRVLVQAPEILHLLAGMRHRERELSRSLSFCSEYKPGALRTLAGRQACREPRGA